MTDGLKPLTVISEDGRVIYDSELYRGLRESVSQELRDWLVRSRLEALIEGEGLTQRSLGQLVDKSLNRTPTKDGKPSSYRAINEYFSGKKMRGGGSAKIVAAMETLLLSEVAQYFGDPASTQSALRGDLARVEALREFLYRADEITVGYAVAGAKRPALRDYYGAPLADDYAPFQKKGAMLAERTTRAVVGVYVFVATASAWEEGLRQQYLAHQACMGLFRAFVKRVARLPEAAEHNPVETAANILLGAMKQLARAFWTPMSRGVDPMTGPRAGLIIDPFLAFPSWRQFEPHWICRRVGWVSSTLPF